jgi:hypothetical protein
VSIYTVKGRTVEVITERINPGRSIHDPGDHSLPPPTIPGLMSYRIDGVEVTAEEVALLLGVDVQTLHRIGALRGP